MTKEIHDINARTLDFVVELIDYIFEYPDDDYMTMECLCRKLVKHGLIDKVDGYYEPKDEPQICDTCRYYNSNIPCGSIPSACKEADKFAKEFVDGLKKLKQTEPTISKMEQVDKDINVRSKDCETCKHYKLACELFSEICKYEPTTQTETQNSNLTFEKDECAKEYEELGLKELKELIEADRKTEPSNSEKPNNCETQIDELKEAKILLKASRDLLNKQNETIYVLNLLEETVEYHGTECDGYCLIDDIDDWLLQTEPQTETKTETQNSNLTFETLEYCDICDHKGCKECIANALDEHCIPSQFKKQIEDECAKEYEELGLKELKELIKADRKTESTGYNLSPVDRDINVRNNNSEKPNNSKVSGKPTGSERSE